MFYFFILVLGGGFERLKKYVRRYDWITLFAFAFALSTLLSSLQTSGVQFPDPRWSLVVFVLFFVLLVVVLLRMARTGRPIMNLEVDERMQLIFAKSAQNALFATYLALFIHHYITEPDTLDTNGLSIVIGSGLFMFLTSLTFYYFRKSF
jgi:hypothetical protein